MKTYKIIAFTVFVFSGLFFSCNKESIVEGYIPQKHKVVLEQPLLLSKTNDQLTLTELSPYAFTRLTINKGKLSTDNGVILASDSLVTISISGTLAFSYSFTDYSYNKYSAGNDIDTAHISRQGGYLAIFQKHSPYTSPYVKVSTYNIVKPAFDLNEEGYLGFVFTDPITAGKTYGWILLQCSNEGVLIKSYGYQSNALLKVGE